VPADTAAANKAVAGKRAKYGVGHILTTGFHVAALERFGYFHPDTTRLARTLGATHASRQAPLMEDHIVAGAPDRTGTVWKPEERAAPWQAGSHPRMSLALQRSNAIDPPARCQRERTGPLQVPPQVEARTMPAFTRAAAEEGGAMPGDAEVAVA